MRAAASPVLIIITDVIYLCFSLADDQAAKPGDEGRSESSAGDGGTDVDGQSVTSGNSVSDLASSLSSLLILSDVIKRWRPLLKCPLVLRLVP
mgnify:FL=1